MDKTEVLEEFGLTNNEAKTYLKLLFLGQASAYEVSKATGILRQTTYELLDSMLNKGIVSFSLRGGTKVFSPMEPKALLQILESKRKNFSEAIPDLEKISSESKEKIIVETFIGEKGIKNIYEDMLAEGKDIYHIMDFKEYSILFKELFLKSFITKRVSKGISFKALITQGLPYTDLEKSNKKQLREIRYIKNMPNFKATTFFYGDKCGYFILAQTPVAILIKNKKITESIKAMFNSFWEQAEKK
jgi:HTH-type transcriptional regulator, sugar sensing transcriptional regulator